MNRKHIKENFNQKIKDNNIILGVGAGTGITAKSSEAGGADLLLSLIHI